jgi:Zn-dependent M28 family amino/carboxypeptidase
MPARGSGRGRPAIVLAAHYDTQLAPRGFVGANDSAAGTAVVVEAARALLAADRRERRRAARDGEPAPSRREVRFVLLDGEELPPGGSEAQFEQDGLRGSTAYAAAHAGQLGAVAVVDYVAGRGLRLPREGQSDPALWRRVRAAAARVGVARAFPDATGPTIIDDHVPFLRRGVPAVDLIDWSYPYKQGLDDRLRRLSERAIDATGETMVDWLIAERRR